MPLADLKPAPYNPRTISEEALEGLTRSLSRFGLVEPIVYNQRTGYIVGGHQRAVALQKQGVAEAQVLVVSLSAKEEKELNVALNKLSGDWDYTKLKELLTDLSPTEDERVMLGFSEDELTSLLKWGEEMSAAPDSGVGLTPDERLAVFENAAIKQIVLYFKSEQYVEVLKRMKELCESLQLETNSDVFLYLLKFFDENATRRSA